MAWDLLSIFCLQAVYVAVTTVRWIILVRGRRFLAAVVSFFEVILYMLALSMVVTKLGDPTRIAVYAMGYAVGVLLGSLVEERLAIGYVLLHIITHPGGQLTEKLRGAGLGVTEWLAEGREGHRLVLMAVAHRKLAPRILEMIEDWDPRAFVVQSEPRAFRGGSCQSTSEVASRYNRHTPINMLTAPPHVGWRC